MEALGEFVREGGIDHAMALHGVLRAALICGLTRWPRVTHLALECSGDNMHGEICREMAQMQ